MRLDSQFLPKNTFGFFLTGFVVFALVILIMPPPIEHYLGKYRHMDAHPWEALGECINGTYLSENYPPGLHESKLTFRIVPQMIGRLVPSKDLYIQVISLFCVQLIMGVIFTFLLLKWLYGLSGNMLFSVLTSLGFMLTHVGSSFTYDLSFFFDGMAFFFLGLALFSRSSFFYVTGLCAAFWTDERAVLGIAGVLLFKLMESGYLGSLKEVVFNRYTLSAVAIVLLSLVARYLLSVYAGMHTPVGDDALVGLRVLIGQVNMIPLAWFLSFKLYWYYLVPLILYLWKTSIPVALLSGIFILLSMMASGLVIDIMRSTSYIFPFILCGIFCAHRLYPSVKSLAVGRWSAAWSLVIPNYRNFDFFYLILPLPFRILKYFF